MNAIAIHSPGEVTPASGLRRPLRLAVAALLSLGLVAQPAWAQGAASPASGDALARYQARHAHAVTIERELQQRVAALEQQDAAMSARSNHLQMQLGQLLKSRQDSDARINQVQAEAAAKERLVHETRAWADQLDRQLQAIQQKIDEHERNRWTCYVPFAQIYCLVVELMGQRNQLEAQRQNVIVRLRAVERDHNEAQARLQQLQAARRNIEMEQARLQRETDGTVQQLKVVHAELAKSRDAHQRHRVSLDTFSAELKQVETLPPSERASVMERRMTRLDAQLASEMGQACSLFTGGGAPLPEPVRQACALG